MKKKPKEKDISKITVKKEPCISNTTSGPVPTSNPMATIGPQSTDIFNGTIDIKQESTSEYKSDTESKNKFLFWCRLCKSEMPSLEAVYQHRRVMHGIRQGKIRIKNINLIPDISDPNFYCKACETRQKSSNAYRTHLRYSHHMNLVNLNCTPKFDSIPDPKDPNNYCCSCKKHFKERGRYRSHLRLAHGMKFDKIARRLLSIKHPDLLPDLNDPNNYCRSCERSYTFKTGFVLHCKSVHQVEAPKVERPNLNDLNFYCKICNITFMNLTGLRCHCSYFHPKFTRVLSTDVVPDVSDPNNHCRSCVKTFCSLKAYNVHLTYFHKMLGPPSIPTKLETSTSVKEDSTICLCCECGKIISGKNTFIRHNLLIHTRGQANRNSQDQPDPDNPNFYCRICKRTYPSKTKYRKHIRTVHWMKLESLRKQRKYNNDLPDPQDPNLYCRVCQYTYSSRKNYRIHCRVVHKMKKSAFFAYPDAKIDMDSPDYYCAKCDKRLKSTESFNYHLKMVHKLTLAVKKQIGNPDATIDVNDPNCYCAKCDRRLSCRATFSKHLKNIHYMKLIHQIRKGAQGRKVRHVYNVSTM